MTDKKGAKAEKDKKDGNPVSVTIFGQSYSLRAEEDGPYLAELARYVDTKMRSLSESTGIPEPLKVAVLTAINVADELFKLQKLHRSERDEAAAATQELLRVLDESLREPTQTSPALP